jgi:hypothetical protein
MSTTKNYQQWLVIDWKTGDSRTRKSEPAASDLNANELLAELVVDVEVPEVEVPTLAVEIEVPEPQVYQATMEALDEADLPDWTAAANDVLEANTERIETADRREQSELINDLTTRTLMNAPGRPATKQVREYIELQVGELAAEVNHADD